jgi:acyl-CoA reductase-like NAD-dependent aldehyde dehydrogenase
MEVGAATLKRLFLELGGKSAHILLDDADYESIVPMAAMFMCGHPGQGCVLNTRLLVQRDDYEKVLGIAKATFESIKYGDRPIPRTSPAPSSTAASTTGCSATSNSASTRAQGSSPAAVRLPSSIRGSTSGRPCSPTSTT